MLEERERVDVGRKRETGCERKIEQVDREKKRERVDVERERY